MLQNTIDQQYNRKHRNQKRDKVQYVIRVCEREGAHSTQNDEVKLVSREGLHWRIAVIAGLHSLVLLLLLLVRVTAGN